MIFVESNVEWNEQTAPSLCQELVDLGYHGAIWTYSLPKISAELLRTHICPIQNSKLPDVSISCSGIVPLTLYSELSLNLKSPIVSHNSSFLHLRRLHLKISSINDLQLLNNYSKSQIQSSSTGSNVYDLISIEVKDDKTWMAALNSKDFDIFCLDFCSSKLPFSIRRNQLKFAEMNNIFFEISLDKCIADPTARKNFFQNVSYVTKYLSSSHLLISSSPSTPLGCRSPQDLTNMLSLLGVCSHGGDALNVISGNILSVLSKSAARRSTGPGTAL